MDKSKMQILLTELMSNQKNTASMFSEQEKNYWSLMKRSQRLRKFGHNNITIILGLTIKFIDSDRVLRYIVSLNRDLNEVLRSEVLKQSLLRADMQDIELKRRDLWLQILNVDPVIAQRQYLQVLQEVPAQLTADLHQFIDQDVRRSFNQMEGMTHDNVRNILKAYALANPRVNYSQGMNFVAGFLYLALRPDEVINRKESLSPEEMKMASVQAESLSFCVMGRVIARYQMVNLFNDEVPMLKLMFYQMDRLISIKLPDLHDHFKDESISASLFSSSFFITVFTSHMQAQQTNEDSWKIARVWDHFLQQGWKTLFKVCLLILQTYEQELLQMGFEQLVAYLI
jgi:hypothetical protein